MPRSALPCRVIGSSTDGRGLLGRQRAAAFEQIIGATVSRQSVQVEIGVLPRCFPGPAVDKIRTAREPCLHVVVGTLQ